MAAHNTDSRQRRRVERAQWWADRTGPLLESIASGTPYRDALETHQVSAAAVIGRRRVDPEFAEALDAALMEGRDPALEHGRPSAWKARCRCPDCRDYHEGSRVPVAV